MCRSVLSYTLSYRVWWNGEVMNRIKTHRRQCQRDIIIKWYFEFRFTRTVSNECHSLASIGRSIASRCIPVYFFYHSILVSLSLAIRVYNFLFRVRIHFIWNKRRIPKKKKRRGKKNVRVHNKARLWHKHKILPRSIWSVSVSTKQRTIYGNIHYQY